MKNWDILIPTLFVQLMCVGMIVWRSVDFLADSPPEYKAGRVRTVAVLCAFALPACAYMIWLTISEVGFGH